MEEIVGFDVDDTIADTMDAFLKFYNREYGKSVCLEDFTSYSFSQILGVSQEEVERRVYLFYGSQDFAEIKPLPGSKEHMCKIPQRKVSITARPLRIRKPTSNWMAHHFPEQFRGVYHAMNPWIKTKGASKGEICELLGIKRLVEDNLHFAEECARRGIEVLLYNQPWNQRNDLPENVKRVCSWEEIAYNLSKAL